jgi:hypothetical protein
MTFGLTIVSVQIVERLPLTSSVVHHNANGIATTAEHVLDPMLIPTSFGTQGSIGAHTEARNRVAELGEDIATVHHLLNVHRRIMTQLDVLIANCAK